MKKRKILLVVRHPVGGIRTFFRYVYRTFSAEKYQFTLVAPDLPETGFLREDLKELDLNYVPFGRNVSGHELFWKITRTIRSGEFDLIHSHGFTAGACAALGAVINRKPHILTCHDVFTERQFAGLKGRIKRVGLAGLMLTIDRIHCVSHDARENLLSTLPILTLRQRHVIAIPHGIDVEVFLGAGRRDLRLELGLSSDTFLIGFLGRFMAQKGFRYLVDAVAEIIETTDLRRRPVVLAFGDDGFIREEKEEVRRKGIADVVHFLPFVADVASTLKGLDVVVMPSLWEACGLLAMEAMVAGVPLIGTSCIGLREVLCNTPATAVRPGDSVALAKALISEMKHPTTEQARDFVARAAVRYQVQGPAADLEQLLTQLIER